MCPAVSFGLMAAGQCGLANSVCHTVAQCFGAEGGAGLRVNSVNYIKLEQFGKEIKRIKFFV